MKVSFGFVLYALTFTLLAGLGVRASASPGICACACATAVKSGSDGARGDCSSLLSHTVTLPAAETVVVTETETITINECGCWSGPVVFDSSSQKIVPAYVAHACEDDFTSYSSACSCFGVTAVTTTASSCQVSTHLVLSVVR
jgi:hypothetical protein